MSGAPDELRELRLTLAALADQLGRVSAQVDRLTQHAESSAPGPDAPGYPVSAGAAGVMTPPAPVPPPPGSGGGAPVPFAPPEPALPEPVPPEPVPPESALSGSVPPEPARPAAEAFRSTEPAAPATVWPVPPGAVVNSPGVAPAVAGWAGPPVPPVPGPPTPPITPPPPAAPLVMPTAPPPPPAAAPPPGAPAGSWADTAGLRLLGWVGGGVTVLGIVMLLVIAAQQGYIGPLARVLIGAVLGAVLIIGGYLLRRKEGHAALAVTIACTGLAVEYLSCIGAVRLAELVPSLVGHGLSILIVAVAVLIAVSWQARWLAGASFAVSGLLAPLVGGGYTLDVYLFELIMVAGGAAGLLLGLGRYAWGGAAIAAGFTALCGLGAGPVTAAILWTILVMAAATWALFLGRWVTRRAPVDPGPFPIRQRSSDPAQIARDYADFYAHQRQSAAARADRATAATSMAVAATIAAIALAVLQPVGQRSIAAGITAAVLALLAGLVAFAAVHHDGLAHSSVRVIAWTSMMAFAAVALLRLLEGDIRSVSWVVLAIVILVIVAAERMVWMLVPAVVAGVIALLAAGPALAPGDLFRWPPVGLITDGGLLSRAWTVVLPAGICVLALSVAAWWATSRVTAARLDAVRSTLAQRRQTGYEYGWPAEDAAHAERHRTTVMAWALIGCAVVACYGLLAVTMVLAYAVAPHHGGYQAGQIVVTVLVTVIALVLLWQGFRRVIVRLGGLGLAAVAVGKLLFFDTSTLSSLPRAITVIGVGVLLLMGAIAYVTTLNRATSARLDGATPPPPAGEQPKSANPQP